MSIPLPVAVEDITTPLERMVDRHGLLHVLIGLSLVCQEKADHIRANSPSREDRALANAWARDGRLLDRAARSVRGAARKLRLED